MEYLLHGCDYNPDQWLDRPEILAKDIEYMKQAGINEVTLGIFSWAAYEPQEGIYTFEWMDHIMDAMYEAGIRVILATPSAAKPPWLVKKYPEVMRTKSDRIRLIYGDRENHCNSSKVYREKVTKIDQMLAERYGNHPALLMWHISNEFYGVCHCSSCQLKFRKWLKNKYHTIDRLNQQYNSAFWSHTYQDWDEIESPAPIGDQSMHALALDYQRFYSDLTIDFVSMEKEAIRTYCKDIPVTTNMHNLNCGIDYAALAKVLDVTSWDSYPLWHTGMFINEENHKEEMRNALQAGSEWRASLLASFHYDFCRSLKKQPFLLMESTPSNTNWASVCKLKKPGMHLLSCMHAIASGSDSVQYFQWRQSLGGYEKFHGAVIGHSGSNQTRVFQDVSEVGKKLKDLSELTGSVTKSHVAIIYDWDNLRALELQMSLKRNKSDYDAIIFEYYEALLKNYVSVDVISQIDDFETYDLVIAPVLYLWKGELDQKIRNYISNGGTFLLTAYSGLVNENDLAFESFPPYGLHDVFGIYSEETDALCEEECNDITYKEKSYQAKDFCDILQQQGAEVISTFKKDFYAGHPAVTKHVYGKGKAYYVAARMEQCFLYEFLKDMIEANGIPKIIQSEYVTDVLVREREKEGTHYIFLLNFSESEHFVIVDGEAYHLGRYECRIIKN